MAGSTQARAISVVLVRPRPGGFPGSRAKGAGKSQIEKRSRFARSFEGKRPEELERANNKVIASAVVLPGQAEADEAEGPARGSS